MTPDRADDPMVPPRAQCGARTRAGHPCGQSAMRNGRCRFHGGLSTGPRTPEGLARMRASKTVHGMSTAEMVQFRRVMAELKRGARRLAEVV